jgi:hypothetical protein
MSEKQLLQRQLVTKAQGTGAETADGARGNLQGPGALLIDPQLRMNRSVAKPKRCRDIGGARGDLVLNRCGQTRWRDVNRLLKERTIQRIGFIEEGEHMQLTVCQESLKGDFSPRDKAFDEDL